MSGNAERYEKAMNQGHNAAWDQMWDQAAEFYRQALAEIPTDSKAMTSLALALYETQEFEEALVYYRKASEQTPDDPIPLEKVAELLEKTGKEDRALEAYMKSAELYLKYREVNKGIDLWTHMLTLRPENLIARSRLALVYERLGRKPDALREYLAVASLLQNSGEVQKAIQAVTRALQVIPESTEAQQALAMIKAGRLLPKPSQPHAGLSSQPVISKSKQEKKKPAEEAMQDPITEGRQKAMTALAALLFEQDEQEVTSRRGMTDIVRGALGAISGQADQTKILLHLSQVIDLQSRKQERQAAEELERAIEVGLDHPAAYFNLGWLQVESKRPEHAQRSLKRVSSHSEYSLAVHMLLGQAQMQMQKYPEAALNLLEALRLADMQIIPSEQAGVLSQFYDPIIEHQSSQKSSEQAVKLCENILKMLGRSDWRLYLAEMRKQLPEQDPKIPTPLAEMLTAAGSNEVVEVMSHILRLTRSGKINAAMDEAFVALRLAPLYLPLHATIGDVLLQEGRINAALDKFNMVARSYEIRGETSRAISLYRKVSDLSPLDMKARNNLIGLMVASGQSENAIEEYLVLAEMYYNLADLVSVQNSINEAIRLAQQSNASRAVKLKVLNRQAEIAMQSLNWRGAQQTYEQIRSLQPDDETARMALIDLSFRLGQGKKAEAEISNYVNFLLERRMNDKIPGFLEKLAEQFPQQPVVLRQQAEFLRQSGRREEAIQKMDAAGDLYLQAGDRAAALEVIMAILAMNPSNVNQYQQLLAQLREG